MTDDEAAQRDGAGTYLRGLSSPMTGDTLAMGMMADNLDPGSMMPVVWARAREWAAGGSAW